MLRLRELVERLDRDYDRAAGWRIDPVDRGQVAAGQAHPVSIVRRPGFDVYVVASWVACWTR